MGCGASPELTRIAFEPGSSPHTFNDSSEAYEVGTPVTLKATGSQIRIPTLRGNRTRHANMTRKGATAISGDVPGIPGTPQALQAFLLRALGTETTNTPSAGTNRYTPGLTLPEFGVLVDRVNGISRYEDCKVVRLVIELAPGAGITMRAAIRGLNYATSGLSWPNPAPSISYATAAHQPLVMEESTLTLGGTAYPYDRCTITIDNSAESRQRNARTPDCVREGQFLVTTRIVTPYTSNVQANLADVADAGIAGVLTATNGNVSAVFRLFNMQTPEDEADIGTAEMSRDITFLSHEDDTNPAIQVDVDATP